MPGFGQAWEMDRGICAGFKAKTPQSSQHRLTCQWHSILGVWAGRMSPKLPESCNNSWETEKFHPLPAPVCKWDLLSGVQQPEGPCPWPEREGESTAPAWGLGTPFGVCLQLRGHTEFEHCLREHGPQELWDGLCTVSRRCGMGSVRLLREALRDRAGFWLEALFPCKGSDGRAPNCARSLLLLLKSILMCCHPARRLCSQPGSAQCRPWEAACVQREAGAGAGLARQAASGLALLRGFSLKGALN